MAWDSSFGTLLKRYRLAAGLTGDALAQRIGRGHRSAVSKLEADQIPPGPNEPRLIAYHLGLGADDADEFIAAAKRCVREGAPHRPRSPAGFEPFSQADRNSWIPIYSPGHLFGWRDTLITAEHDNRHCAFALAMDKARLVFQQIECARSQDLEPLTSWKEDEREEANQIALEACLEFTHSSCLMLPPQQLRQQVEPVLQSAQRVASEFGDAYGIALVDTAFANYYYCRARYDHRYYRRAFDLAARTRSKLPLGTQCALLLRYQIISSFESCPGMTPSLIAEGRAYANQLGEHDDHRGRIRLLEGISYVRVQAGDKYFLIDLIPAETEAPVADPLAVVTTLRTRVLWMSQHPEQLDRDQFCERARKALTITDTWGWQRHSDEIRKLADQVGVSLN